MGDRSTEFQLKRPVVWKGGESQLVTFVLGFAITRLIKPYVYLIKFYFE